MLYAEKDCVIYICFPFSVHKISFSNNMKHNCILLDSLHKTMFTNYFYFCNA